MGAWFWVGLLFGLCFIAIGGGILLKSLGKRGSPEPGNESFEVAWLRGEVERLRGDLDKAQTKSQKADDLTISMLKAQLENKQEAVDHCFADLFEAQAEIKRCGEVIADLRREVAALRATIEQNGQMPGYAAHVRKHERADVALRMYREGYSKRQIMRQVWHYVGSGSLAQLNRIIESSGGVA